jgi:hypothetical protein
VPLCSSDFFFVQRSVLFSRDKTKVPLLICLAFFRLCRLRIDV